MKDRGVAISYRILLVEDNDHDYLLESAYLIKWGINPDNLVRVGTLSDAAAAIRTQKFDVMLLDLNIIDSTGLETFESLHAVDSALPIVILSGSDEDEVAFRAVGAGAQDFVSKSDLAHVSMKKVLRFAVERNAMHQELIEAREKAIRNNQFKSDFLAEMSHEIRTPLNGILGITDLLINSPTMSQDDRDLVATLLASGNHLVTLISDILDIAKIESGKMDLQKVRFNLRQLVEEVMANFCGSAEIKNIVLCNFVDPNVPKDLNGDPGRLKQILTNLVGNAVKFTDSGAITIRVELADDFAVSNLLKFSVTDTGPGISKDQQGVIFQSFSQAETTENTSVRSSGLGLTICKSFVELMHGDIGVNSVVGKGSSFWFTARLEAQTAKFSKRAILDGKQALVICKSENSHVQLLLELLKSRKLIPIIYKNFEPLPEHSAGRVIVIDTTGMMADETEKLLMQIANVAEFKELPKVIIGGHSKFSADIAKNSVYLKNGVVQSALYEAIASSFEKVQVETQPEVKLNPRISDFIGLKVLIVDDNKVNLDVATRMTKQLGFEVTAVSDGKAAVKMCVDFHFDAILMDCRMPEMDGFEATKLIRRLVASRKDVPIIALTANAFIEDRNQCLAAGMNEFLSKPITTAKLGETLKKVLSAKSKTNPATASEVKISAPNNLCIDHQTLTMLKELEDPQENGAFVNGLIDTFITEAPAILENLSNSFIAAKSREVEHWAHKLKGFSRNLGADKLSKICSDIEINSGTLQNINPEIMLQLSMEFSNAAAELCRDWKT